MERTQLRDRIVRLARLIPAFVLVVGCGVPAAPPAPATQVPAAPKAATAAPAAPVPAAVAPAVPRLIMAVAPPGRESNDVRFTGNTDLWALRPMYEFLIGLDPKTGTYIPQLATEWTLDEAGPSVRFKLRKGVQFHGGHGEFTSRDVVFTREQMRKDDTINGWRSFFDTAVKDIEVVNDHEVVFHLSRADPNLLDIISEAENGFEIRSAAHFDKIGPPSMESGPLAGTGAYQFKERAQGQHIRFERVPFQHWRAQPDFPEFEFRFQREASTRLAALLAGEVHITALPADLQQDAEKKGFGVISSQVPGLRTFMRYYCCIMKDPKNPSAGWEYPESPLMDVRVRKALNKAINRDELNKAFFEGKGEPMYVTQHHQTRLGWDPSWVQRWPDEYGYDPAAARALLAEAGHGPGKPATTNMFVLPMASIGPATDVQESVAGYWRAIGVQAELLTMDPVEVANGTRARKFSNHVQMWANNSAMFTGFTGLFLTWGGRGNGFEDYDVDRYALEAVSTFEQAKQDEAWRRVGEIHYTKHAAIPLFWLPAQTVINTRVVSEYTYPGNVTGSWTHVYTAKAAR